MKIYYHQQISNSLQKYEWKSDSNLLGTPVSTLHLKYPQMSMLPQCFYQTVITVRQALFQLDQVVLSSIEYNFYRSVQFR